jgi:hypothetical protein
MNVNCLFVIGAILLGLFLGWTLGFSSHSKSKEEQRIEQQKRELEQRINTSQINIDQHFEASKKNFELYFRIEQTKINKILDDRDKAFNDSFSEGRQWLADFIADCKIAYNDKLEDFLRSKERPAPKTADAVRDLKKEKRKLIYEIKMLEYQLLSYEEYFPFLEDYKDAILEERVKLGAGQDNLQELSDADPVQLYLSPSEYEQLSNLEKNQLALNRYLTRHKNNWEIGRMYERYLDSVS